MEKEKGHIQLYKASAGSGKTYTLTLEYLSLMLMRPNAYRHILAVTFTNKATNEMKRRIVEQLHLLSTNAEQSPYCKELCQRLKITPQALQSRAEKSQQALLNDYSRFQISTIDRFFQQTIRSFAREIGVNGGYAVELDDNSVLVQSIDNLMLSLDKQENKQLLNWLIELAEQNIELGEGWNFRRGLERIGKEIFKESYKLHRQKIDDATSDKDSLKDYITELRQYESAFPEKLKDLSAQGIALMSGHNLSPSDFKGAARSPWNVLFKWEKGEIAAVPKQFPDLYNNIDAWRTKLAKNASSEQIEAYENIFQAYEDGLNDCVGRLIALFENDYRHYLTANLILKNLYALGILWDIDKEVRQYENQHQMMLINNTNELLNRIIDNSDTPFIYEKTGVRINHYMMDEFQDTSLLQWKNFYPLLTESLANGHRNLIVGDVKQSIYRFRNSDWKLLAQGVEKNFSSDQLDSKSLQTNWRSSKNVILFNNTFFASAAQLLQEAFNEKHPLADQHSVIQQAYADVCQEIPAKNTVQQGIVEIQIVQAKNKEDFQNQVLEQLPNLLARLQTVGYRLSDIAVLTRTKDEGAMVVERLLQYNEQNEDDRYSFDVLSGESLYLANIPIIKAIIAMLRYTRDAQSKENQLNAYYETGRYLGGESAQLLTSFLHQSRDNQLYDQIEQLLAEMREHRHRSLFEVCEYLIVRLLHGKEQAPYLQAFQDIVLEYMGKYGSDIGPFLKWWDKEGVKRAIASPEQQEAVTVMTIHKSKGLEFKIVLIPFADWKLNKSGDFLWCHPQQEPFDKQPVVPVRCVKDLAQTYMAEEYAEEELQSLVDGFNVSYVAFTRACQGLFIFTPEESKTGTGNLAQIIKTLLEQPSLASELNKNYDSEQKKMVLGQLSQQESKPCIESLYQLDYPTYLPDGRLQLNLYGKGFFNDSQQRNYGTLMHQLLSKINVFEELEPAMSDMVRLGELSKQEMQLLLPKIQERLSRSEVKRWFSNDVTVLNEVAILEDGTSQSRPDRVVITEKEVSVIDYKFGNKKRESYKRQIENYVDKIKRMGYPTVKGYLWYVELDEIEPC